MLVSDTWPQRRIAVRAEAERGANGLWSVSIAMEDEQGIAERGLNDASSCVAAAEAAAVVVAIALEPGLSLSSEESPAGEETGVVPDPPPKTPPEPILEDTTSELKPDDREALGRNSEVSFSPPVSPRSRRSDSGLRGAIGFMPEAQIGTLPGIAGGGQIWGALLLSRVRLAVVTGAVASGAIRRASARIALWRWTVAAQACPMIAIRARVEIAPCVAIESGVTLAGVSGLVDPRSPRSPWVAASAQPMVGFSLGDRLALWAGARLVVPLIRHRFMVDGLGQIYRPAPVGAALLAGLEVRIP